VDSLQDTLTIEEVTSTLKRLKKGADALNDAYSEARQRIEGQLKGKTLLAKRALSWITYAQRPLSTQELCHALAIKTGDQALKPERIYDVEDILDVCAGLVTVDGESNIVRLVHYTTQEYFERIRSEWCPQARQDIASACITYLSMDAFLSGSCESDEAFEARLRDNIFLDYSARNWGSHAKDVQQEISSLVLPFLRRGPLVLATIQAALVDRSGYRSGQQYPRQTTGFHLVARYGLNFLAGMLLKEPGYGLRADSKDMNRRTPLSYAAWSGHEAVVRLLVEREDVEADSKDEFSRTPLSYAAGRGHEAVVRLLVEREDVEADSKDGDSRTPLSYAAERGHEAVVKLLES
jgi:hypothetical protein